MADDLVTRLRDIDVIAEPSAAIETMEEAADTIERLIDERHAARAFLAADLAAVERLLGEMTGEDVMSAMSLGERRDALRARVAAIDAPRPAREREIELMRTAPARHEEYARKWLADPAFRVALHASARAAAGTPGTPIEPITPASATPDGRSASTGQKSARQGT